MTDERNMQTIKPEELDRVSGGTGTTLQTRYDRPGTGSGEDTLITGGKNTAMKELK